MGRNASRNEQLAYVGAAIALASNTDDNSTILDMSGYEGVVFFSAVVDSVSAGTATLTVEQSEANADGAMAALSGATATITSAVTDDVNGTFIQIDVYKPAERYVQCVRTTATANMAFGEIYAIRYGPRTKPITNHSTRGAGALVASPAEA